MSFLANLDRKLQHPDLGLLLIRLVIGGTLHFFGAQKFHGGKAALVATGHAIDKFGLPAFMTSHPAYLGAMSASIETVCGLFIILGVLFRPSAFLVFLNMIVATVFAWDGSQGLHLGQDNALPLTFCLVVLGLLFTGPGKFALQKGA